MTEDVLISRQRLNELLEAEDWLGWLEQAGVDNWEGCDIARELKEEYENRPISGN